MQVILKNVRLSYPDLWTPGDPPPGSQSSPKYGAQGIFAPNSVAAAEAKRVFLEVATAKWGANAANVIRALPNDKKCIRTGNMALTKDGSIREGYADMLYIVARNKARPAVVDRSKRDGDWVYLTEADGKPYGGCIVEMKVDIYAMDKPRIGKSINATLLAVRFWEDGEPFGAAPGNAEGFEDDEGPASNQPQGLAGDDLFGSSLPISRVPTTIDPFA